MALVDLTHHAACRWLKGVTKEQMLRIGISGWMADDDEYLLLGA